MKTIVANSLTQDTSSAHSLQLFGEGNGPTFLRKYRVKNVRKAKLAKTEERMCPDKSSGRNHLHRITVQFAVSHVIQ